MQHFSQATDACNNSKPQGLEERQKHEHLKTDRTTHQRHEDLRI